MTQHELLRDQDLISLKNNFQILGYVVEQYPGDKIRVFRPIENDTVDIALKDIAKLSKVWVQNFSPKEIVTTDTIEYGRFNNKKHVFQISILQHKKDIERYSRKGFGLSYYRSFNNNWLCGGSLNYFNWQDPAANYADKRLNDANHAFNQVQILQENKFRISRKPQNKRMSALLIANCGYVIDNSRNSLESTLDNGDVEFEDMSGGLMLQIGIGLRINPDNQSGFIAEAGYAHFPQIIKQYTADIDDPNSLYLGYRREVNGLLNIRLGYFF